MLGFNPLEYLISDAKDRQHRRAQLEASAPGSAAIAKAYGVSHEDAAEAVQAHGAERAEQLARAAASVPVGLSALSELVRHIDVELDPAFHTGGTP